MLFCTVTSQTYKYRLFDSALRNAKCSEICQNSQSYDTYLHAVHIILYCETLGISSVTIGGKPKHSPHHISRFERTIVEPAKATTPPNVFAYRVTTITICAMRPHIRFMMHTNTTLFGITH